MSNYIYAIDVHINQAFITHDVKFDVPNKGPFSD